MARYHNFYMKHALNFALILIVMLPACAAPKAPEPVLAPNEAKLKDMEKRNAAGDIVGLLDEGLWYKRGDKTPFSGKVVGFYKSGQKESLVPYTKGILHGTEIRWYANGKKRLEVLYNNGAATNRKLWDADGNPSN
tara:strand:+ start:227 stop:634 length:408 start_codon:yes stop_codon:yes gene_type:complete